MRIGRRGGVNQQVLWRKPPVLALAAVGGTALGRVGEPSTASPTDWAAAGVAAVASMAATAHLPMPLGSGDVEGRDEGGEVATS